jgi:hypothetical protein
LCDAKRAFDRASFDGDTGRAERSAAERQLALCESSDWFWWFGDYNPADAVMQFDRLYRRQLVNLYRILKLAPPENLSHPLVRRPRRTRARRCHAARDGGLGGRGRRSPAGI